jgi:hypothetical protein
VENGGEGPLPHLGAQDLRHVRIGLAGVDDQRQLGHARCGDMAKEPLALRCAGRIVVVVVEADLADGDDRRILGDACQIVGGHVRLLRGVVGMRADRAEDALIALGQRLQGAEFRHPRRDGDHGIDAGGVGAGDDRVAVLVEVGEIEMAVAVDEHHGKMKDPCSSSR